MLNKFKVGSIPIIEEGGRKSAIEFFIKQGDIYLEFVLGKGDIYTVKLDLSTTE